MNRFVLLTLLTAIFMLLLLPANASAQVGGGNQPTVPAPRLWLNTTAIDIAISGVATPEPGLLAVAGFKFGNTGQADLRWRLFFGSDLAGCAVESAAKWISVAPASGTAAPGVMGTAQISVNALPDDGGTHSALLCFETNDPRAASVTIPVTVFAK